MLFRRFLIVRIDPMLIFIRENDEHLGKITLTSLKAISFSNRSPHPSHQEVDWDVWPAHESWSGKSVSQSEQ